jgi:hypothetical protein
MVAMAARRSESGMSYPPANCGKKEIDDDLSEGTIPERTLPSPVNVVIPACF